MTVATIGPIGYPRSGELSYSPYVGRLRSLITVSTNAGFSVDLQRAYPGFQPDRLPHAIWLQNDYSMLGRNTRETLKN